MTTDTSMRHCSAKTMTFGATEPARNSAIRTLVDNRLGPASKAHWALGAAVLKRFGTVSTFLASVRLEQQDRRAYPVREVQVAPRLTMVKVAMAEAVQAAPAPSSPEVAEQIAIRASFRVAMEALRV
ncbi:hypothetical protein [Hyphomicrobium sulfonivorans]|nr:hypothetical protein [Hyphomicrobium sulfonivorans]